MLWDKKAPSAVSERPVSEAVPVSISDPGRSGSNGGAPGADAIRPGRSILGQSIRVKGELRVAEELLIEGQFDGALDVHGQRVTIGREARVKSDIQAREAVVHGTVHGNISAQQRVEIRETGHVTGDIVSPSVVIEAGAYYKGKIEILNQETKDPVS